MTKPVLGAPRPQPRFIRDSFFSLNPGSKQFLLLGNEMDLLLHYYRKRSWLHTEPTCKHCQHSGIEWRRFISVMAIEYGRYTRRGVIGLTPQIIEDIGGQTPRGLCIVVTRGHKNDVAHGELATAPDDRLFEAGDVALLLATRYKVPLSDLVEGREV